LAPLGIHAQNPHGTFIEVHYSPAENLETVDLGILDKAQHNIDMVLYAFDDKPLAAELLKLAQRGVTIRIYRDQTQYEGELARGKKGGENLTTMFAGVAGVQIKIKGSRALAHLKAYCVDCDANGGTLREGSANWSAQGEKVQDNSLLVIRDRAAQQLFESNFAVVWARPTNQTQQ
jgi:phosphatidylserine/phosphatidylglycerophosphate/cardiolipin synthase-like enzyme